MSCHFMCQGPSHKPWNNSSSEGLLMTWFTALFSACSLETSSRVSCLMPSLDSEKRMKASLMTRPINVTSATCPDKWWKRRDKLFQTTLKTNISSGITCFTLSHWKGRAATTTPVWSMRYLRSTTCQMKKWMYRGFHRKGNQNLISLNKPIN